MIPIAFGVQSYAHSSAPISAQRLINGYAEAHPRGAKASVSVHGMPGVDTFATVGRGPIRGFFKMNGVLYVVSRDSFYSVVADGTATLRGTGLTGLAPVRIDGNGEQIAMVDGTLGFLFDEAGGTFTQITDGQFNAANTVTHLDGYFIYDWKNTNKFFNSDLLDGASYSGLMFASAESKADRVLATRNINGVLRVLGEESIEAWASVGAGTPPFQRLDGATISTRGIAAPLAVEVEDEAGFIFGDDRVFYRLNGSSLQRLSTHAMEKAWAEYTTVTDAFCFIIPWGGHKFVYLTFPGEGKTFGYDLATGLWHERMSWDASGAEVKWRANCCISAFNKVLIGDANSGRIGFLSSSVHTEFDNPVRFISVSPPIFDRRGRLMSMSMLEVDIETGVGEGNGQGADPQIMLDWSDDGGRTWVSPQTWRAMGKVGEYRTRLQWDRLGSFYNRTLRLQVSDPVRRTIIDARAAIEVG